MGMVFCRLFDFGFARRSGISRGFAFYQRFEQMTDIECLP
jgi:hypothetical protein